MAAAVVVVGTAAGVASYVVQPDRARSFDLYYGTTIIDDNTAPVAVDLASGRQTIQMEGAADLVHAAVTADLSVVPLANTSLLLDTVTGEFNMIDTTGFVVKNADGGVRLPAAPDANASFAVPSGDSAYIVQTGGPTTGVYLVNQSTVTSALNTTTPNLPRASASVDAVTGSSPGTAVAANGDLWMLTGSGSQARTLRELQVPEGSDAGAALSESEHGTAPSVSALATATTKADGSGAEWVALATSTGATLIDPDGNARQLTLSPPAGTTQILPAGNLLGSFSFLYRSTSGWTLLSISLDGDASVHTIPQIPTDADLAQPAQSRGSLYTITTSGGRALWRIDSSGAASPVQVGRVAKYPLAHGESGGREALRNATVIARGARVIYNSRVNNLAVTVFTDRTGSPVVINKRAAERMDSAAGIAGLAAQHVPEKSGAPKPAKTEKPEPVQPINDKVDCSKMTQVPYAPAVRLQQRASRSVQLAWSYPVLSPQDCMPSTYTVEATLLSGNGPQPPGVVTVQGQQGLNLLGLFPDTKYRIVVTAYINEQGTASQPLLVSTSPEGPPAPTGVHTNVDDKGNWTIAWQSCGGMTSDCVPTAGWKVLPTICDAHGLASPPTGLTVAGDPTAHTFHATYPGGAALLGRGLRFEVQGVGNSGLIGDSAGDNACLRSWAQPVESKLSLTAGLDKASVASGGTTSATVTLNLGRSPVVNSGGAGATYAFDLLRSDGSVVARKPGSAATTVSFDDIEPGLTYRARAIVSPPGHPDAAVTVGPVPIESLVSEWPALTVAADGSDKSAQTHGRLAVTISGVSSAAANRETFDLSEAYLRCPNGLGSGPLPLSATGFDPAAGALSFPIDRSQYFGSCTVTLALAESGPPPTPVYGNVVSPTVTSGAFTIPQPDLGPVYWDAAWNSDISGVNVTLDAGKTGTTSTRLLQSNLTTNWRMELYAAKGSDRACNSVVTGTGVSAPIPVDQDCAQQHSTDAGWQWSVRVTFDFPANGNTVSPDPVTVSGTSPSPVVAGANFEAHYTVIASPDSDYAELRYNGEYSASQLAIYDWTETVCDGVTYHWTPGDGDGVLRMQLPDTCTTDTVTITSNNDQQPAKPVRITGTRPSPISSSPPSPAPSPPSPAPSSS